MNTKLKNLYLLDGHALCYRAFYAIKELSNSKGFPTNAIYGVINMLEKIKKKYSPEYMVFAFDSKGKTKRHEKYDQYKIQRKPMPEDLSLQISKIKEVIEALNIPIFQKEGYEADDIIATLAGKAKKKGMEVSIVTADKDALQLVDQNIRVISPASIGEKIYGEAEVQEKFGVLPDKLIELMSLTGDASDNIPGIKGIGPVTARKLIKKFGSLKGLYENIDKIDKDQLKKKLINGRKMAELSKELLELDMNVPVEFDPVKAVMGEPQTERLIELFKEFEFHKLLKEIAFTPNEIGKYHSDITTEGLRELIDDIKKNKLFSFSAVHDGKGCLCGICLSTKPKRSVFVGGNIFHQNFSALKPLFDDPCITKVVFDLKKNIYLHKELNLDPRKGYIDIMLLDYIIDPSKLKYDLSSIALRTLGHKMSGSDSVDWGRDGQAALNFENNIDFNRYCEEADILLRIYEKQYPLLKEKQMLSLYEKVEMPLTAVLAEMEQNGVGIDSAYLDKKSLEIADELKRLTEKIYNIAGEEFNINSPKQLRVILFEKLGLPVLKKTKTGASTNEEVLTQLSSKHELPAILLKYRELNKLKTAYYDSIKNLADGKGRIYAKFNQAVTATGRLSSSEPNLQNIPIKTKEGREIRKAFVPVNEGNFLIAADYSQIELRILAHLSKDKVLISAFEKGEDVHTFTASLIYNCDQKQVTKSMRSAAKTVNFGIVYGMSAFGLSKDLGISVKDAQDFIDAYFLRYKYVSKFISEVINNAKKNSYVTTILNRRRYVPEINSPNERVKAFAERIAVNTPVQGSAADLIKLAMIGCYEEFSGSEVKMLIQVHDELVFEAPENMIMKVSDKIKKIMENVIKLEVPLKVDIEAGPNWLEMKDIGV